MALYNLTTGVLLTPAVEPARSYVSKLVGLLGRRAIAAPTGMWLEPCSAIHTIGMRAAIDVIFLDAHRRVIGMRGSVGPNRPLVTCRGARVVLEMGAGFLHTAQISVGDTLALIDGNASD